MSLVLGVDVGSQSIKVVLVDEGGDVVATGSAALTMTHQHDGWAEQVRTPIAPHCATPSARRPQASTDAGRGDGPWQSGRRRPSRAMPTASRYRPAIIWLDKRATEQSATGWSPRSERKSSPSGRVWWPMPRTVHRR